jgi:hypothetical protein
VCAAGPGHPGLPTRLVALELPDLGQSLAELAELDRLRSPIAMLIAEIPAEPAPRLSAFLAWAKEHLAKREARLSAQALGDGLQPSICSVTMMITV